MPKLSKKKTFLRLSREHATFNFCVARAWRTHNFPSALAPLMAKDIRILYSRRLYSCIHIRLQWKDFYCPRFLRYSVRNMPHKAQQQIVFSWFNGNRFFYNGSVCGAKISRCVKSDKVFLGSEIGMHIFNEHWYKIDLVFQAIIAQISLFYIILELYNEDLIIHYLHMSTYTYVRNTCRMLNN